jgi:hypothetical protein
MSISIQGNNVHSDKGKSVAHPIEQPTFSYKRCLGKNYYKLAQKVMKTTLFVKDVATYWLNASHEPKRRTVTGHRKPKLVGLNQDQSHVQQKLVGLNQDQSHV